MTWFQQDSFKGCLFVRAVAESNQTEDNIISIARNHKLWIQQLIAHHCLIANHLDFAEMIYTLIEGMISRFLVDGLDLKIANKLRRQIECLLQN